MPIDGIRISAFFTTHLTTDQPSVCNTLTNTLFAPIQQLIGQKKYQCLQGRVYELASAPQLPSAQLSSAWKVIVIVAAIFSTPCGILTRYLSFYSSDINLGYWIALLFPINPINRSGYLVDVHSTLQITIQKQLNVLEKQKILDQHITSAITFLLDLETKLYGPNPLEVKEWLAAASEKPDYLYPFQLVEKLTHNSLLGIPNRELLRQFEGLLWNCNRKMISNPSTTADKRQQQITNQLGEVLKQNHRTLTAISSKIKNLKLTIEELTAELDTIRKSKTYAYPFYTQPLLLEALKNIATTQKAVTFLATFEQEYKKCSEEIKQNPSLMPLINDLPPPDHSMIAQCKLAMAQLANIRRLEALYIPLEINKIT